LTPKKQNEYDFTVKKPTHTILVRNISTGRGDSKKFSIHAPNHDADEVKELIKDFLINHEANGKLREFITFTNEKQSSSHTVCVMKNNPHSDEKASSSFRVTFASYSSQEISDIIRQHITKEPVRREESAS